MALFDRFLSLIKKSKYECYLILSRKNLNSSNIARLIFLLTFDLQLIVDYEDMF